MSSVVDRAALAIIFTQILEGWDIPTPVGLLRAKPEDAARQIEGLPYSWLTNLAHAVLWQEIWLQRMEGTNTRASIEDWKNDWRVPAPEEWPALRRKFIRGLEQARAWCTKEPFDHHCKSDEKAIETLAAIAIHAAYHMGQMNVLKRALKR